MPEQISNNKQTLTLVSVILGICISLVVLWNTLAKPAANEAGRAQAVVVMRDVEKSLNFEVGERKAEDVRNYAEHREIEKRLDQRLTRIENGPDELLQESRRHR